MAGMSAEMDAAEAWAEQMRRDTPETAAEWRALTGAICESRTKEALVLGKLDVAERWARRGVERGPSDPRAYLELGQVLIEQERVEDALANYRMAVRFGPPGTEIGWFMAGQCLELLDRREEACDAYLAALAIDPLAISAAERLSELASGLSADVGAWARTTAESLRQLKAERGRTTETVRPYQRYAGVLGR
jgi:tetratricopeptide (TPR) repeat protein